MNPDLEPDGNEEAQNISNSSFDTSSGLRAALDDRISSVADIVGRDPFSTLEGTQNTVKALASISGFDIEHTRLGMAEAIGRDLDKVAGFERLETVQRMREIGAARLLESPLRNLAEMVSRDIGSFSRFDHLETLGQMNAATAALRLEGSPFSIAETMSRDIERFSELGRLETMQRMRDIEAALAIERPLHSIAEMVSRDLGSISGYNHLETLEQMNVAAASDFVGSLHNIAQSALSAVDNFSGYNHLETLGQMNAAAMLGIDHSSEIARAMALETTRFFDGIATTLGEFDNSHLLRNVSEMAEAGLAAINRHYDSIVESVFNTSPISETFQQLSEAAATIKDLHKTADVNRPFDIEIRLVNSVKELLYRLLRQPDLLFQLSAEQFEFFICDRLDAMGFAVERPTDHTFKKDGGVDIIAWHKNVPMPAFIAIQAKHHRTWKQKVKPRDIRELIGTLVSNRYFSSGLLVTNSTFTSGIDHWKQESPVLLRFKENSDLQRWLHGDFSTEHELNDFPETITLVGGIVIPKTRLLKS